MIMVYHLPVFKRGMKMEKTVLYEKMSKKAQKEYQNRGRVMLTHQCCPVVHKSVKDKNRQLEKQQAKLQARNYSPEDR